MTGTAELLRTGGAPSRPPTDARSPRSQGIRQGLFIFLLTFVIAPIVGLISTFGLGIEPWPVGIVIFLLGVGGILRMVYALMFESKYPAVQTHGREPRELDPPSTGFATSALPPQREYPAAEYASPPRREHMASEPASVTDDTTKLLERDPD